MKNYIKNEGLYLAVTSGAPANKSQSEMTVKALEVLLLRLQYYLCTGLACIPEIKSVQRAVRK